MGIGHLVRRRPTRFIAVAAAIVLVYAFATIPGRVYYTAGFPPFVLAMGAIRIDERDASWFRRRPWLGAPMVGLVLTAAFILPVLPLSTFAQLRAMHTINFDLGETVGWPQLTRQVAAVYDALPASERGKASIVTSNYGEAGAITLYSPPLGLPSPLS